jgi:sugar/nucleoside kinase (ribokinase family)
MRLFEPSAVTLQVTRKPQGVLCSGSIVFDVVVRPVDASHWGTTTVVESIEYHVGGNGANTSYTLAMLGVPTRLLGMVGRDDQGRFLLERLGRAGVDLSGVGQAEEPTAATVALVNSAAERKLLHRPGVSVKAFAGPARFTPELTAGMSHYHLASLFILPRLRAHAAEMLARARAAGLSTSFDTNWDSEGRWMRDLEPCLPHLDFFFTNQDEARMVTGSSDPAVAAQVVRDKGVRTAVIKLGRRGCAIFAQGSEVFCPAFDVVAKDSTGAGDCFVGGFLAAVLRGASLAEAGRYGNAVGALSVERIGAIEGVLSQEQTEAWMRSARLRVEGLS